MKSPVSLLFVPALLLITACSSHYSVSNHGHRHHRNHVSVGVHGSHHGDAAAVVGALIVGGVIGHILTEEANQAKKNHHKNANQADSENELVNGYPITSKVSPQAEKTDEQNRFYKLGKDGKCYLMEKEQSGEVTIIAMVPEFSCR